MAAHLTPQALNILAERESSDKARELHPEAEGVRPWTDQVERRSSMPEIWVHWHTLVWNPKQEHRSCACHDFHCALITRAMPSGR